MVLHTIVVINMLLYILVGGSIIALLILIAWVKEQHPYIFWAILLLFIFCVASLVLGYLVVESLKYYFN